MVQMVLQHRLDGLTVQIGWLETRIEWFGNAHQMVLQRGSYGLETHIEWFCNADQMVWKGALNGFATRIKWFGNLH